MAADRQDARQPPDLDEYAALDPALLAAAGWTPEELYWEELSAAGLALAAHAEAADYWREAAAAAEALPAGDPRRATTLANLALADPARAETLLQQAATLWAAADAWVAALRPERRARSSLFHLRLARKHPGGYDRWSEERYGALLAEGRDRFAARRAGRLAEADAYGLWRRRRPAAFDDARRLIGAVFLLAPAPASPGPPG